MPAASAALLTTIPADSVPAKISVMWKRTNSWAVRVHANCRRKRSTRYAMARLSSYFPVQNTGD